jgi:hypothetical protein
MKLQALIWAFAVLSRWLRPELQTQCVQTGRVTVTERTLCSGCRIRIVGTVVLLFDPFARSDWCLGGCTRSFWSTCLMKWACHMKHDSLSCPHILLKM